MANRGEDKGDMVMVMKKMNSKYNANTEKEVVDWVNQVTGSNLVYGRDNFHSQLKNGQTLVKLINEIYEKSSNLPATATAIKTPIKANTSKTPFAQMENIEKFLAAVSAYGVTANSSFQTVDLYEARNLAQVINGLLQLGSECQRNGFSGPVCGPKPCSDNRRKFTLEQLKSSEGVLTLQAGTNKFASQQGMTMGSVRHCNTIPVSEMHKSGKGVIGLQSGTNKFANQSGMSMGGIRHVADMKVDNMNKKSESILGLQSGYSKGANQSGMTLGAIRQIADTKIDPMNKQSESIISLQLGYNKGANQSGMSMGGIRHIADMKVNEMTKEGKNMIGLQYGSNKGASQAGMHFGGQRHITNIKCDPIYQIEQSLINMVA